MRSIILALVIITALVYTAVADEEPKTSPFDGIREKIEELKRFHALTEEMIREYEEMYPATDDKADGSNDDADKRLKELVALVREGQEMTEDVVHTFLDTSGAFQRAFDLITGASSDSDS